VWTQTETYSGLVGAIWQVRDNLSFDAGFRYALLNGHPVNDIRAGLTFGFDVGGPAATPGVAFGNRSAVERPIFVGN
jgi:long-subunit fatty acid transport protein